MTKQLADTRSSKVVAERDRVNGGSLLAAVLAAVILATPGPSWSCATLKRMESGARSFVVSAVLKREGRDAVIKLVHSQVAARNAREAARLVLARVEARYAGYVVLDTLTSELDMSTSQCTGRIEWTADVAPSVADWPKKKASVFLGGL